MEFVTGRMQKIFGWVDGCHEWSRTKFCAPASDVMIFYTIISSIQAKKTDTYYNYQRKQYIIHRNISDRIM